MTNIPENLIKTLNDHNIHTVILPNQDYSQAFEDSAEAFDDIVDDIKNNYFKTPTKKELKKHGLIADYKTNNRMMKNYVHISITDTVYIKSYKIMRTNS